MSEEATNEQQTTLEVDYLKAIDDLKKNSVPKTEYDKLRQEHQSLLNDYINNNVSVEPVVTEPTLRPSKEINHDLFESGKSLTNMEFIDLSCELRDAVLAETGDDIFVVVKPGEKPSEEALTSARRTADVYKQCLAESNGNATMFNALLQQRMQDTGRIGKR